MDVALHGPGEGGLDGGDGDVPEQHGVLVPGGVVDVEQAAVCGDQVTQAETLVTVASPAHPVVVVDAGHCAVLLVGAKPPYDPVKDFMPITKVGVIPLVLAVSPSLKINSIKEFAPVQQISD